MFEHIISLNKIFFEIFALMPSAKMTGRRKFLSSGTYEKKIDCFPVYLGTNYNKIRMIFLFLFFRFVSLYTKYFVDSRAASSFLVSYR